MNFKKETQKNLLIVFGLNILEKIVVFLGLIVLARLLKPEDFGILVVAEILIAFIGVWNEHVFETSVIAISDERDFDTTLNIAFICRVIISLLLYVILYAISRQWARYYNNPQLFGVINVLGLNILITNMYFIPNTILIKERRFDKLIIPTALRSFLLYLIAIILALYGLGFWSLVWSRVITCLIVSVAFFIIRPWTIRVVWNKKAFSTIFHYARTMYLYMFLIIFINQIDKMIVGKVLGLTFVGYYALAFSFGSWMINNIFAVADRVAFPLYSALKEDSALLRAVYLKFFKYILFLSVPISTSFILFAKYFIHLFLGAKWAIIEIPLKILCFASFFGLIGNISNSILKSINRLDIEVKRNLALAVMLLVILFPFTLRYGLIGSCIAILISSVLIQIFYFNYTITIIKLDREKIARMLIIIFGSSLCAAAFYIFCDKLFINDIKWVSSKFGLSLLCYLSTYLTMIFLFMRNEFVMDFKTFLKD